MDILFDKLQYIFQWTGFAATEEFKDICIKYVDSTIGASLNVDIDTPAPLINSRTIDKSALRDPLDKGGQGKAFFDSNPSGQIAAIKLMERTSKNHHAVNNEVQIRLNVTAAAEQVDNNRRILRVIDVIYHKKQEVLVHNCF